MDFSQVEREKEEIRKVFAKVREGLAKGVIDLHEAEVLLQSQFGTTDLGIALEKFDARLADMEHDAGQNPHSQVVLITGFAILMVALFAALFYSVGGITGAVILEPLGSRVEFVQPIPNFVSTGDVEIDLSEYFEGEGLEYSVSGHATVSERVVDGVLLIYGLDGSRLYTVSASDGYSVVWSNSFSVNVVDDW